MMRGPRDPLQQTMLTQVRFDRAVRLLFSEGEVTIWGELVVSAGRGLVTAAHPGVPGPWMVPIVDMVNNVVDHFRITDEGRLEIEASGILLVVDTNPDGTAWTVAGPGDRFVESPRRGLDDDTGPDGQQVPGPLRFT